MGSRSVLTKKNADTFGRIVIPGGVIAVVGALFLFPYVVLLLFSNGRTALPDGFLELVGRSVLQAGVSGVLAVFVGLAGVPFLLKTYQFKRSLIGLAEGAAFLPIVVPGGVAVLAMLELFPGLRGLWAIVLAHSFMSCGFISVVISRLVRDRIGASLELAWVEGASQGFIWCRGILPKIKGDLFRMWLTVFASSLASFSVPLLLGGTRAYTFEIAIYQAVRLKSDWGIAAGLSLFQLGILLIFLFLFHGNPVAPRIRFESKIRSGQSGALGSFWGVGPLYAGTVACLYSLLRHPVDGWAQLKNLQLIENWQEFLTALQGSFLAAVGAGLLTAICLLVLGLSLPGERVRKWLSAYVAPSTAVTGFSVFLLGWGNSSSFSLDVIRIAVASTFLFAPVLWRMRWDDEVGQIQSLVNTAETLGANSDIILKRIVLPRFLPIAFWSGGLVAFWVWGDYAISSVVASRNMTLGLLAKSLMESYRLEAAALVFLVTLVFGGITYFFFDQGGPHVRR